MLRPRTLNSISCSTPGASHEAAHRLLLPPKRIGLPYPRRHSRQKCAASQAQGSRNLQTCVAEKNGEEDGVLEPPPSSVHTTELTSDISASHSNTWQDDPDRHARRPKRGRLASPPKRPSGATFANSSGVSWTHTAHMTSPTSSADVPSRYISPAHAAVNRRQSIRAVRRGGALCAPGRSPRKSSRDTG